MLFELPKRINLSPFMRDVLLTALTSAITMICNIWLIRLIARGLGPEEFGAYTLIRRTSSTLIPFTTLSIGIGIARYLAFHSGRNNKTESILPAGLAMSLGFSFLIILILFPFSAQLGKIIFRKEGQELLFQSILFLIVGYNFYTCLYSYYRGYQKMTRANIWQIFIIAIFPIPIAYYLIDFRNAGYLAFGIGSLFYLSLFDLVGKLRRDFKMIRREEFKSTARDLLFYSLPRAPGGVALSFIFTFGVLISPYLGTIANAAYISIAVWIFQIIQASTTPFGLVVLPKASNLFGRGKEDYLKNKLRSIYDLVLQVGVFATIQLTLILDFIIFVWLGKEYSEAIPIAQVIILTITPFFLYVMLRNIIDAIEERAINAYNVYISLLATITSSLIFLQFNLGLIGLAIGLDLGLCLLGFLTYLYVNRRYHMRLFLEQPYLMFLINILMGLIVYLIKYKVFSNEFSYRSLIVIISVQFVLGTAYFLTLGRLGCSWAQDIKERIFSSNPGK